jgi:hypothetical protein
MPDFREHARSVVTEMVNKGWDVRVLWGRRTKEENDVLVGRGTASATSKHLTGEAVDLIYRADPYPNDRNHPYYRDLEKEVKKRGLIWGGDFKSRWDPTHFENP